MLVRTLELVRAVGLPKSKTLRVLRTVQPDVRLPHPQWVLHHLVVNRKRF
jgi:hypothetical protein